MGGRSRDEAKTWGLEPQEIVFERKGGPKEGNHHHHSMPFLAFVTSSQLPGGQVVKNPPANAGDADSIPGSGRSPGGGNGNTL